MKNFTREQLVNEITASADSYGFKVIDYGCGDIEVKGEFIRLDVCSKFPSYEEWVKLGQKNVSKIYDVRVHVVLMREVSIHEMGALQTEVRDMQTLALKFRRCLIGNFVENC